MKTFQDLTYIFTQVALNISSKQLAVFLLMHQPEDDNYEAKTAA
jgi:hypothetical protein